MSSEIATWGSWEWTFYLYHWHVFTMCLIQCHFLTSSFTGVWLGFSLSSTLVVPSLVWGLGQELNKFQQISSLGEAYLFLVYTCICVRQPEEGNKHFWTVAVCICFILIVYAIIVLFTYTYNFFFYFGLVLFFSSLIFVHVFSL